MRRLTTRLRRRALVRRLAEERGASAVMVALLLVPLLGCGAIAVDVASYYSDRVQLQGAADAAALAIAADCAKGNCGNTARTAEATQNTYAAAADRGDAALRTPAVSVNSGQRRVTVTTSADAAHWFAPVFGDASSRVTTRATASWAPTSAALAKFPLVISWCEYVRQMNRDPSGTQTFRVNATTELTGETCTGPDGSTPVQAGYAVTNGDRGNAACGTTSSVDGMVSQYTGMYTTFYRLPVSCSDTYLGSLLRTTIIVPIWDRMTGSPGTAQFHVFAYAAFYIEGYDYLYTPDDPALIGRFSRAALPSDVGVTAGVSRTAPDLAAMNPAFRGAYSVFLDS